MRGLDWSKNNQRLAREIGSLASTIVWWRKNLFPGVLWEKKMVKIKKTPGDAGGTKP